MRKTLAVAACILLAASWPATQQWASAGPDGNGLVGTWLLVNEQREAAGAAPANVAGARGLLVFDGAGHMLEVLSRPETSFPGLSEAQARFRAMAGSWGTYEADLGGGRITFHPLGARSPNVMGREFSRQIALDGDRLTVTSLPGELHTPGITRWTWERVPPLAGLTDDLLGVMGFWQHEVEGRKDAATGETLTEVTRAPSVIVYTPAGFVGVHFPTRDRPRFAGDEPTDAEAEAARGHLGYFAALGVYPGMVFHNILGGGLTAGSTLRRFYEVRGDELHLTFPPNTGRDGRRSSTYVRLRRLSGADAMLGR